MDESWRMQMGMPGFPRRRSTEDTSLEHRTRRSKIPGGSEPPEMLDPDDFADVFGGPPRSLLVHKLSRSTSFYDEIFQPPEFITPLKKPGWSLPPFKIPASKETFCKDIFGSDDERKTRERSGQISKTKSMSNSSSMLSFEDFSPLRQPDGADVALSTFALKLRPIHAPCKWNSSTMMPGEKPKMQGVPAFPDNSPTFENQYPEIEFKDRFKISYLGFSKKVTSPETTSHEPNSYRSMRVPVDVDDWELNSSSSAVFSLCQDMDTKSEVQEEVVTEHDEDEDEAMSSYVIELNCKQKAVDSDVEAIDEAIAWAKEKFLTESRDKGRSNETQGMDDTSEFHGQIYSHRTIQPPKVEQKLDREMELLDKDLRMWSAGKESDIRLLLSTLHHIIHANSGWYAIPLMDLTETSQVKNAYQRARLCLHPDKLQQRGVTPSQKYTAQKAFSILQDAWTTFLSQDVLFN